MRVTSVINKNKNYLQVNVSDGSGMATVRKLSMAKRLLVCCSP